MKIHDYPGFPNPARVRIALHEKGVFNEVEFVHVDVPAGAHKAADFHEKNPSRAVPVLELDCGTCISECTAITEYIDQQFGEPELTGATPRERAVVQMMQRRAEQYVMDAVGGYFHHATEGLGPDIEEYQCPEWGQQQKQIAQQGMEYFDHLLATQPFLAGEEFSMADITLFTGLGFADFVKLEIPAHLEHLSAWRQRVASRPSVTALEN